MPKKYFRGHSTRYTGAGVGRLPKEDERYNPIEIFDITISKEEKYVFPIEKDKYIDEITHPLKHGSISKDALRIFKGEGNNNIKDLFNYAENFNEFSLSSFLCDLTRYLKENPRLNDPRVLFHNFLKDRIFEYFGSKGVDYKTLEALDSEHLEIIFKNIDNLMAYCEVISPDKTIKDVLLLNQDDLNKAVFYGLLRKSINIIYEKLLVGKAGFRGIHFSYQEKSNSLIEKLGDVSISDQVKIMMIRQYLNNVTEKDGVLLKSVADVLMLCNRVDIDLILKNCEHESERTGFLDEGIGYDCLPSWRDFSGIFCIESSNVREYSDNLKSISEFLNISKLSLTDYFQYDKHMRVLLRSDGLKTLIEKKNLTLESLTSKDHKFLNIILKNLDNLNEYCNIKDTNLSDVLNMDELDINDAIIKGLLRRAVNAVFEKLVDLNPNSDSKRIFHRPGTSSVTLKRMLEKSDITDQDKMKMINKYLACSSTYKSREVEKVLKTYQTTCNFFGLENGEIVNLGYLLLHAKDCVHAGVNKTSDCSAALLDAPRRNTFNIN